MRTPHPGDLVLVRSHDPVGLGIRICSTSSVNHVAIVDERASGVVEATHAGVRRGPLPDLAGPDCWLFPLPRNRSGKSAAAWAAEQLGRPYGWALYRGFARRLLHLALHGRTPRRAYREALVCSTLAVACWRAVGCDPCPGLPDQLVTPADLFQALARSATNSLHPARPQLVRALPRSTQTYTDTSECAA